MYSERARQVIFLTRLESGARGAEMIGVEDLFAALIVEDQNKISDALSQRGETGTFIGLTTHQPFLPPDAATSLLENIRRSLPRSQSIPTSADMAISPALAPLSGTVGRIAQVGLGTSGRWNHRRRRPRRDRKGRSAIASVWPARPEGSG